MTATPPPSDDQPKPSKTPDYEDFRDPVTRVVDWRAFRAAVAAYDPGDAEAAPSGG